MNTLSILLINVNTYPKVFVYPIGLDYLVSSLRSNDYSSIDTLDLALHPRSTFKTKILEMLSSKKYDVIGFSFRNLTDQLYQGQTYTNSLSDLLYFVDDFVKKNQLSTSVILGGSACSLLPKKLVETLPIDHIVYGDGEDAFLLILRSIERKTALSKELRLPVHMEKSEYTRGSWGFVEEYQNRGAMANIQTKRGCSKQCVYCSYPVIEGKIFRMREASCVASEMLQIEKLGFNQVYIVDATFNHPLLHSKWVLEAFKKHHVSAKWTAFFNPLIDQELLTLIKETNMAYPMKFTIESGSDRMLESLQKGFDTTAIRRACRLCRENDIPFSFTILFGAPGETKETVLETCRFIKEMNPAYVSSSIGVFIYPKTKLAEMTKGNVWHSEDELLGETVFPYDRKLIKSILHQELDDTGIPFLVNDEAEVFN